MSFDKLSKYPVTTDWNDYHVDVEREHIAYDRYQLVVTVFLKRDNPKWWQKKFERVYRTSSGWGKYDEISVNIIGYVSKVIAEMERKSAEYTDLRDKQASAVTKFEDWDGDLR